MINSITLNNLRNAEFLQFRHRTTERPRCPQRYPWYNAFTTVISDVEALFKMDRSNSITEELQTIDHLRDKLDAYYEINEGAEPFAKTTNELNALVDQYNSLITGRKSTTNGSTATPAT